LLNLFLGRDSSKENINLRRKKGRVIEKIRIGRGQVKVIKKKKNY